jgi:hypothetical protein
MDFRKALLLIPMILFIVPISGCTVPGIGQICIPFLPCDKVVEMTDDVIVINSLEALPQTVSPGQQIRLITYIENKGKEPVPQEGANKPDKNKAFGKIEVSLYDFCEGLFKDVKIICEGNTVSCTGNSITGNKECKCDLTKLLPGQMKEISWTLVAGSRSQVPLKTECDLKVSVTYPYKTTSLSTITFIDYQEMQNQINKGTFKKRNTYIVSGYGPVKPRMVVEDQQPIPVQQSEAGKTVISLNVKNSGNGYLCRIGSADDGANSGKVVCDSKIPAKNVEVEGVDGDMSYVAGSMCAFPGGNFGEKFVTLIKKESPPYLCEIQLDSNVNLPKETTEHVTTSVEYLYEFRKEIKVTIEPKI